MGFFIIRYIEEYGLVNGVGVGRDKPQIYFIPNEGHLSQADAIFLNECENSKLAMETNLKNLGRVDRIGKTRMTYVAS